VTLIVGIRCSDGIVVAGDGAATLGSIGAQTAAQKTVKKLRIIQRKIVVGAAGSVGISQRAQALIEQGWQAKRYTGRAENVMGVLRRELWEQVVGPEWTCAGTVSKVYGQAAATSASSAMVVAIPLEKRPELIQFDHQCAPELATRDLPFVAIGSGQAIADPFLAMVRRVFWPSSEPSLEDGIFSAVWTLRHAIETNPGGVADPVQVTVLERPGKDWEARELDQAELDAHENAVKDAEDALRDWRSQFTAKPSGDPPEAPPG
jgi:20S proteasome alpha/beta subunit